MVEVIPNLFVGSREDYLSLSSSEEFTFLLPSKTYHAEALGYKNGKAAPKGPNYLYVEQKTPHRLILNIIDGKDKEFFNKDMMRLSVEWGNAILREGKKLLVACDLGKSRSCGVTIAMLVRQGKLPKDAEKALSGFKQLYPDVELGLGIKGWLEDYIKEMV